MENKTAIELVTQEFNEMREKHGHTLEGDLIKWDRYDLKDIGLACVTHKVKFPPKYETEAAKKILKKTYLQKLAHAGAFILAEMEAEMERLKLEAEAKREALRKKQEEIERELNGTSNS